MTRLRWGKRFGGATIVPSPGPPRPFGEKATSKLQPLRGRLALSKAIMNLNLWERRVRDKEVRKQDISAELIQIDFYNQRIRELRKKLGARRKNSRLSRRRKT